MAGGHVFVKHCFVAHVDKMGYHAERLVYLCDLERHTLAMTLSRMELQIGFALVGYSSVAGRHMPSHAAQGEEFIVMPRLKILVRFAFAAFSLVLNFSSLLGAGRRTTPITQ